jgi:adenosylmethionine-8-amino-7-oxononanoate aminotransferase
MAAMSATGMPEYWEMLGPVVHNFVHIESPYPYRFTGGDEHTSPGVAAANLLEAAILREGPDTVAAFIAEPVQGAGGVIAPQDDYFARIRDICNQYDVLLISDEVITGFGRTGTWFGLEHWDIEPDIMQFAKGITSGYIPLGGIGVSDKVKQAIDETPADKRWMHAYTYSGHPTCCAVALANLKIIDEEGLVQRAAEMGNRLHEGLHTMDEMDHVGNIRGIGMMAAVELVEDKATKQPFPASAKYGTRVGQELMQRGLYTRMRGDTICLAPPFVTTVEQIDQIVEIVRESLKAVE